MESNGDVVMDAVDGFHDWKRTNNSQRQRQESFCVSVHEKVKAGGNLTVTTPTERAFQGRN